MTEFNTGLPSTRQVQTFIKSGQVLEVKLITNEVLVGKIAWQDDHCLCLISHSEESTLIWRHALVYIQPKS